MSAATTTELSPRPQTRTATTWATLALFTTAAVLSAAAALSTGGLMAIIGTLSSTTAAVTLGTARGEMSATRWKLTAGTAALGALALLLS